MAVLSKLDLSSMVTLISIIGASIGAVNFLASKGDVDRAMMNSEFRTIELQLGFNDYRLREIELQYPDLSEAPADVQRKYEGILDANKIISSRRQEILNSGAVVALK